jgi:hypothetical protein
MDYLPGKPQGAVLEVNAEGTASTVRSYAPDQNTRHVRTKIPLGLHFRPECQIHSSLMIPHP